MCPAKVRRWAAWDTGQTVEGLFRLWFLMAGWGPEARPEMKTCAHCGQPATQPQKWTRSESIPYRQQGWVGDQFVPYDRKWKGVRDTRITLCGLCFALECLEIEKLGEKDVNELQRELLQLAETEVTARKVGAKRAATKTLKDSRRVSRNPNGRNHDPTANCKALTTGGRRCKNRLGMRQALKGIERCPQHQRSVDLRADLKADLRANGHSKPKAESPENTVLAESAACGDCLAYTDIRTYKLWRQAGFQVQKREDVGPGFRVGKATLFCKHQVKEVA